MRSHVLIALGITFALGATTPSFAADPSAPPVDKKAIENMVRDVLREHPEIIVEAIESYRAKQEENKQKKAKEALSARRQEIETGTFTPVVGNPMGSVTVVEFFDYQCGYCKRSFPSVLALIKTDKTVRYAFKEFPILGPASVFASRAALAIWKMDKSKYLAFHTALMTARGGLNDKKILRLARQTGIDTDKLKKNMKDPEIDKTLQKNMKLAQELNITGTPAFIVGDHLIPGAVTLDQLEQLVAAQRKK